MRGRLVLLLVTWLAATAPAAPAAERQRVTVLHTSDLHGRVLPYDDTRARPEDGSLAQVASVVAEVRREAAWPVLVFDSGDALQGTPLEQFVHVRWGEPSPMIAAMNRVGYDAMAVGNHEFNFGLEVLRRAERQAQFPILSANSIVEATGEPAFTPYVVLKAGPVRVGVLGLVTPRIPGWEMPEHYRGLRFEEMEAAAHRWVPHLRTAERCDLVVVLAHTGFERHPVTGEPVPWEAENFAWRLAQLPGIDLLLTGHTHMDLPPQKLAGTIVAQPSSWGRAVTRVDLELERTDGAWCIVGWSGSNLPTVGIAGDAGVVAAVAPAHRRVIEELNAPVGELAGPVSVEGCRLRDCAALDLIHEAQLRVSGAQLSLASLLTDRTGAHPAGPVSWRWIHALYIYPNTVMAVRLTGAQIRDVLEHVALYYDGLECGADGTCAVIVDPYIPRYNVDTMAGVTYRIDPTRPEGERIRDLRFGGLPIDPEAAFTVACNSYRAAGGGGFPHLADAPVVWRSSEEMTSVLAEHLGIHHPWAPRVDMNWFIGRDLAEVVAQ